MSLRSVGLRPPLQSSCLLFLGFGKLVIPFTRCSFIMLFPIDSALCDLPFTSDLSSFVMKIGAKDQWRLCEWCICPFRDTYIISALSSSLPSPWHYSCLEQIPNVPYETASAGFVRRVKEQSSASCQGIWIASMSMCSCGRAQRGQVTMLGWWVQQRLHGSTCTDHRKRAEGPDGLWEYMAPCCRHRHVQAVQAEQRDAQGSTEWAYKSWWVCFLQIETHKAKYLFIYFHAPNVTTCCIIISRT